MAAKPVRPECRDDVVDQGEQDQHGGAERHRDPVGAPVESPYGVEVRGGRPLLGDRGVGIRRGQQPGCGGALGDRPEPLGGTGDEDGAEQRVRRGGGRGPPRRGGEPDRPPRRDADQHGPQHVGGEQRPAAVETGAHQAVQRAEQHGAEQQGRRQPRGEHGGHGERQAAREITELPTDPGGDHGQREQHQQAEPVRGTADQLGRPQPAVGAQPEQCAGPIAGTPGGGDLGEVG